MPREKAKDNQWWFGTSALRAAVESQPNIVLRISGRECLLTRSAIGSDGRPTMSFKFVSRSDAVFWESLRGETVDIDVVGTDGLDVDLAYGVEDEPDASPLPAVPGAGASPAPQRRGEGAPIARQSRTLFDDYIAIDWSAAAARCTGKDSVWTAFASFREDGRLGVVEPVNHPTRGAAISGLQSLLLELTRAGRRILVAFDFPYGLPLSGYSLLGVASREQYWALLESAVVDQDDNRNNRFEVAASLNTKTGTVDGPFWGAPVSWAKPDLSRTKPPRGDGAPADLRRVEETLRAQRKRPFSAWQLYGNGSVGSQALVGIPHLERLRKSSGLGEISRVWPFEEGWSDPTQFPLVVHAEMWPGAVDVDLTAHPIRDAAQVLSVVEWMAREDAGDRLASWLSAYQGDRERERYVAQEGWILGVRPLDPPAS